MEQKHFLRELYYKSIDPVKNKLTIDLKSLLPGPLFKPKIFIQKEYGEGDLKLIVGLVDCNSSFEPLVLIIINTLEVYFTKGMWDEFMEYIVSEDRPQKFKSKYLSVKIDEDGDYKWKMKLYRNSCTITYMEKETWESLIKFAPCVTLYINSLENISSTLHDDVETIVKVLKNTYGSSRAAAPLSTDEFSSAG